MTDDWERFWGRVLFGDGCWERRGGRDVQFCGRKMTSARVAWLLSKAPMLDGLRLARTCGNLSCVRPSHLDVQRAPSPGDLRPCSRCGETFRLTETTINGHQSWCFACKSAHDKRYYDRNIERKRARDAAYKSSHREESAASNRKNRAMRPGMSTARSRRIRAMRPEVAAAHEAVGRAIKRGLLVRLPCESCGASRWVHAHHDDYSRPLDVRWLCPVCHAAVHRERRRGTGEGK